MSLSPENQTFISALRFRIKAQEPIALEEMQRAIAILREGREATKAANAVSGAKKPRASKAAPTAAAIEDALSDLDNM